MLAILSLPTLAYHAGTLRQPTRSAAMSSLRMTAGDDSFDLDVLAQRIQSMQSVQEPANVRLFVLDAMTPGQRLSFAAPPPLWETLQSQSNEGLVMFGMNPARRTLCTHGVSITVEESSERSDGGADVVLAAGRLCELIELGGLEGGSRWQGHEASVRWVNFEAPDESLTDEVLARSDALSARVETWCALVRDGRERSEGQLDGVMRDLGPMPSADAASERALWIAGLIKCAASPYLDARRATDAR